MNTIDATTPRIDTMGESVSVSMARSRTEQHVARVAVSGGTSTEVSSPTQKKEP